MEGILKPNVQEFLDKMADCKREKEAKLEKLAALYPALKDIRIPDRISDNITLSTMHGCPPEEIRTIGRYLIEERGYHTTIKMNPTLLGPERLRDILNRRLGYETNVPDEAFGHDLKYEDALELIASLRQSAGQKGVHFGLKLTNTLESMNHRDIFPPHEKMMYMSGRALHPISINTAALLQESFNGELDLSFSAGVDCFNVSDVLGCGIKPVTMCSDLLKPGGYGRLPQYLEQTREAMKEVAAGDLDEFILNSHGGGPTDIRAAAQENLNRCACRVLEDRRYGKSFFPGHDIKTPQPLFHFDCIQAPCQTTCPAHQGIPDYMYYTAAGDYPKAFDVILKTNPFPSVTGMVCDHACMTTCTRVNYDSPLRIRDIKRFAAEQVRVDPQWVPAPAKGIRVAVIGAGPSGLACAFFLAMEGVDVQVYEAKDIPGGMVSATIPMFRLKPEDIHRDIRRIQQLGVHIHYNQKIDKLLFKSLRETFDYVYVAVGASKPVRLNIEGENLDGVMDGLDFLGRIRSGEPVSLGNRIAVVGGGNSAVDAARTAWRLAGSTGAEVVMLYRRTRSQMPAAKEEIIALEEEGVQIRELTNPVKISSRNDELIVTCWKMKLGDIDQSGRPRPVKIDGSDFDLCFDTVISAIGQQKVLDFLDEAFTADPDTLRLKGKTAIKNLFIGGDALRGPFNIISAVADGKKAADTILDRVPDSSSRCGPRDSALSHYQQKSARRVYGVQPPELSPGDLKNFETVIGPLTEEAARAEAARCLQCGDVCNVCVTVCPNRANISYTMTPVAFHLQKAVRNGESFDILEDGIFKVEQPLQVLNIADFCNECGNCLTFCPTSGAPYKDKPKLCLTEESFLAEANAYFIQSSNGGPGIKSRRTANGGTREESLTPEDDHYIYETETATVILDKETLHIKSVAVKAPPVTGIGLHHAAEMAVLLRFLPGYF
jgi:putative selenate reductase